MGQIQIVQVVSPSVARPYLLIETYPTSEGMRTRVCAGRYATMGEAEFQRGTLEAICAGGGQR
ncbi:MAG: hypothetical protein DI604_17880 [Delftia acidovorans]|nr:MAG: hypothetical protein DI604_17880 [Delftia acidovorans]